jgi:hypothetical protein
VGFLSTLALILTAAAASPSASADTLQSPYADAATSRLVARARARRATQDSLVADYTATLRYRLTLGAGRRRWATAVPIAAEEQVAQIAWQRRNDLRVDVVGRRTEQRSDDVELASIFDQPWFVPRDVEDSVRVVGADFPASGALHPLAEGADLWYRYAILDSLQVQAPGGAPLRVVRLEVVPRRGGRPLVAGRLWLDAETGETVRFAFRYTGAVRFAAVEGSSKRDSSSAQRRERLFRRFASLELDLEYGRQDGRFWMPARQTISGRVVVPLGEGVVVPFEAVTTFDDYRINAGAPIAFTLAASGPRTPADRRARRDSLRAEWRAKGRRAWGGNDRAWDVAAEWRGGRFEIHRPSNESLKAFDGWTDSMQLAPRPADAARVRELAAELDRVEADLPDEVTETPRSGFGYERLDDAARFNRVQGATLGAGYWWQAAPFTRVYGTARFGFGDDRLTGRLGVVRDAPGGRLVLAGYRDVQSVDAISSGRGISASANAIFAAHDYADYRLATGGSASFETEVTPGLDVQVSASVQEERSVVATSRSQVNDFFGGSGLFQPDNPPVAEGWFVRGGVGLLGTGRTRWTVQGEVVRGAGETVPRAWGDLRLDAGRRMGATLRLRGGVQRESAVPQLQWRVGGPNTVRGYAYGSQVGAGFWAAQFDVALLPWALRPVVFADVGQAAPVGDLFRGDVQAGGGVGLALYSGILRTTFVRLDFSRPFETGGRWRFDLVLGAVR